MAGIVNTKSFCAKFGAHFSFSPLRLDLSIPDASHLKKLISEVVTQYELDFPAQGQEQQLIDTIDSSADRVDAPGASVQLAEVDLTADTYKEELATFEQAVQAHHRRALDAYITANACIVVDDGSDMDRRKRKLLALPVAAEKKRKLFVKDFMVARCLNWGAAEQEAQFHV